MKEQEFGPTLKALLKENGMSQAELCRLFDVRGVPVSSSAVSQWISQAFRPDAQKVALLLELVPANDGQRQRLLRSLQLPPASSKGPSDEAA